MDTPEQEKAERQRLDETFRKLNEITAESLIQREELGQAPAIARPAPLTATSEARPPLFSERKISLDLLAS